MVAIAHIGEREARTHVKVACFRQIARFRSEVINESRDIDSVCEVQVAKLGGGEFSGLYLMLARVVTPDA